MDTKRATKEDVYSFLKINGPCLPNDVKRKLGGDNFLMGAYLSELVNERKARVSTMKVGGSPLYMIPGQEYKLQNFSHYLNEKDKIAYGLLRDNRVLRDKEQPPLIRVALRSIKDFAIPLEVTLSDEKEIFWRWFLLNSDKAQEEIRKQLTDHRTQPEQPTAHRTQLTEMAATKPPAQMHTTPIETRPALQEVQSQPEPIHKAQPEIEHAHQTTLRPQRAANPPVPPSQKATKKTTEVKSAFLDDLNNYFTQNKIEVEETHIIKKTSEIDFIIRIPSSVGKLRYFCKAKSKKKINEGDLSSAYVSGEAKKLPVLFLTTGELNKRAKEMLPNEFKNMTAQFLN